MKFVGFKAKKEKKVKVKLLSQSLRRSSWAIKMFMLSLCLSSIFSLISQSLMNSLGVIVSVITISIFILISILFDMIGIAATSCKEEFFKEKIKENVKGAEIGLILFRNSEKVCSFCADVVGDICGILSGAGGACVILSLSGVITNPSLSIIISTLISAFIAGVTIFGKAFMKEYAIKNSNEIILKVAKCMETLFFKKTKKKS